MGLITVLWIAVGFSLAFGDGGGFIGNFDFAFLADLHLTDADGAFVPASRASRATSPSSSRRCSSWPSR